MKLKTTGRQAGLKEDALLLAIRRISANDCLKYIL